MSALLLDLDGTLVDSRFDLAAATNLLLTELGLQPLPIDAVVQCVGRGARALVGRALDLADPECSVPRDTPALRRFLTHYESVLLNTTVPFPGVVAGLESLVGAGIRLAVVTNKPVEPARRVLDGLGLTRFFPVVLGGDSLPTKKPHPGMLRAAAEQLAVPLSSCVMVGDSDVDIEAARAAGIRGIWCSWGGFHPDQPPTADRRIDRFAELLSLSL